VCHCQRLNRNQGLCNPPGQAENKRRNGNNGKWQKRGKNQEASKTKAGKIANKQKKKQKTISYRSPDNWQWLSIS